jgi:hypothetical protein
MPLIKNAELWFAKVDPDRPNRKFNKKNPTWEVQLRTRDKAQKKEWENMGLSVKTIDPDDDTGIYYRVNLKKRTIKADGEASGPVEVIYGNKKPADPKSIGNGSIANVRIYQYDYDDEESGKKGTASVLMGIQLVKHIMYTPKERDDDFEEVETEIVDEPEAEEETLDPDSGDAADEDEQPETEEEADEKPKPKAPSPKKPAGKFD